MQWYESTHHHSNKRPEEIEEQQPQYQALANIITHNSTELKGPLIEGQWSSEVKDVDTN